VISALLLLLSACTAGSPVVTPEGSIATPPASQVVATSEPNGSPTPAARDGGSIVMGGGLDPGLFNTILFPKSSCVCNALIFSTLFRLNDAGSGVTGELVDHWDVQADGLGYLLTLRANAKWHDGQPVVADDVVFTLDQIRNPKNGSSWVSLLGGIDSYSVVDDKTVKLTLKEPTPALLSRLTRVGVLPKHLLAEETNLPNSSFNLHPIGSGPFKFESYTPGVQLTLVRNDQYFRGRPHLDKITFRFLADPNAAVVQLKSGELDLARLNSVNVPALSGATGVVVNQFPTNGQGGIQLNLRNPALADLRVRQALSYGIDREAISKGVYAGVGQIELAPIASTSPFYSSDIVTYSHDPAKAASLLDSAGWTMGANGVRQKDGKPLGFTMVVNSESVTSKLISQTVQAELKDIGVGVNLQVVDFATWRSLVFNYKFDLFSTAFGSPLDPDDTEYNKYFSTSPGNLAGLNDPEIDRLLTAGRHEIDPTKRKAEYASYQRRMTELLPLLFIGYDKVIAGSSSRLHGLAVRPVGYDGDAWLDNAHLWWVTS
jgi:peptide/nickel transport system substrate-binding protein